MSHLHLNNQIIYYIVRRDEVKREETNDFMEVTHSSFIDATIVFEKWAKDFPDNDVSVIEVRGTTILTRHVPL